MLSARRAVLGLVLVLGALSTARAQVGMPDPSQMSGVPLPSPELSTGVMTVRVVRGSLSNNLPGQRVELSVQGQSNPRIGTTDASGRNAPGGISDSDELNSKGISRFYSSSVSTYQ